MRASKKRALRTSPLMNLYPIVRLRNNSKTPANVLLHLTDLFNGYVEIDSVKICRAPKSPLEPFHLKIAVKDRAVNNARIIEQFSADEYFLMTCINSYQTIYQC